MTLSRFAVIGLFCAGAVSSARAFAQDSRAPRAGEAFLGTVFGHVIEVAERDRTSVTSLTAELLSAPEGPEDHRSEAAGALFLWRNRDAGHETLRAEIAILANEARWTRVLRPGGPGFEAVISFETSRSPGPPRRRSRAGGIRRES